jgi:transposase
MRLNGKVNSNVYVDMLRHWGIDELPLAYSFMHDNAPIHTSRFTAQYLEDEGVRVLKGWPPYSPDLNPIENLWAIIKGRLNKRSNKPSTIDELAEAVESEWNCIGEKVLQRLFDSMPTRIRGVIRNQGFPIRY